MTRGHPPECRVHGQSFWHTQPTFIIYACAHDLALLRVLHIQLARDGAVPLCSPEDWHSVAVLQHSQGNMRTVCPHWGAHTYVVGQLQQQHARSRVKCCIRCRHLLEVGSWVVCCSSAEHQADGTSW